MAAIPVPNNNMVVGSGLWSVGIPPPDSRSAKVVISEPPKKELLLLKRLPKPRSAKPPPPPHPVSMGTIASNPSLLIGFKDFIDQWYPLFRSCYFIVRLHP